MLTACLLTLTLLATTDDITPFSPGGVVTTANAYLVQLADVDGDGDPDVVWGYTDHSSGSLQGRENLGGSNGFGPQQSMTTVLVADPLAIDAYDVDGDGDLDVLVGSCESFLGGQPGVSWVENTDGLGTFGPRQAVGDPGGECHAGDLDGDGDADVVAPATPPVWMENLDGLGTFGSAQPLLVAAPGQQVIAGGLVDLDTDGDLGQGSPEGPSLSGCGSPLGGTPASVSLTDAPAGAAMLAWISFAPTPLQALGGTVHAYPFASPLFLTAETNGSSRARRPGPRAFPRARRSGSRSWTKNWNQTRRDLERRDDLVRANLPGASCAERRREGEPYSSTRTPSGRISSAWVGPP